MIHSYNEEYLSIIQEKLALMFELAVLEEKMDIDQFAKMFASSLIAKALEKANPIYTLGKSANELLALLLNKDPINHQVSSFATPEYWVGWILAYNQWYYKKSYQELIDAYPCSKLILNYFPYHEEDITHSLDLFKDKLDLTSRLKQYRLKRHLNQAQLSLLSKVPLRSIKAYEQGKLDLGKAQGETLYALSQVLHCTIEELIA